MNTFGQAVKTAINVAKSSSSYRRERDRAAKKAEEEAKRLRDEALKSGGK